MSDKAKSLIKGETFDTERLVEMGLLPAEFLRESETFRTVSVVTEVDDEAGSITLDTLPPAEAIRRKG